MKTTTKEKLQQFFGCCIGIVVIVVGISYGMKYQKSRDEKFPWRGSFYIVKEEQKSLKNSGQFETLDACKNWASNEAKKSGAEKGTWEFSCGKDCSYTDNTIVSGKRIKNYECKELITE